MQSKFYSTNTKLKHRASAGLPRKGFYLPRPGDSAAKLCNELLRLVDTVSQEENKEDKWKGKGKESFAWELQFGGTEGKN